MDLRSYVRKLTRHWRLLLTVFVLVGAALTGVGFLIPQTYTANVRMVFAPNLGPEATMDTRQVADLYLASRIKTYAQLVTTNQVLRPVIDSLNLGDTVPELVKRTEVTIPKDTLVVSVSVTAPTAASAAATANRIADEMPWAVANLERSPTVALSPVQVSVLQPADVPSRQTSPNVPLNLIVAAVLAIIAGITAAVVVDNFGARPRKADDGTDESVAPPDEKGRASEVASGR